MTYLITVVAALTIFVSCNGTSNSSVVDLNLSNNQPDTSKPVITSSFQSKTYPQYFQAAYHEGTKASEDEVKFEFYKLDIGKLKVETGYIIACDPIVMHDASPFTQVFPKGEFPVELAMVKSDNEERVALSRILFSSEPVVKWEFALQNGQKAIPLKDTTFYCYGVDAGTGIFIDSIANSYFESKDQEDWSDVFIKKAEQNGYKGFVHDFEGHNLATFSTGYGDGCYATYIGFDSKGNPCQLLTDFGLIGWWKLDEND